MAEPTPPVSPVPRGGARRPRRSERLLIWVGAWLLRLLVASLRLRVEHPERLRERVTAEPYIWVFWHNQLLLIPVIWNRFLNAADRPLGKALTSLSGDGELVALFLARFGVDSVRGSSARGGAGALRELAGWLKRGHDIGLTPDGSRGPIYEIKPGLVLLAQLSGRPILPLSFEFSSSWRLKSWDRFFIPKPFSQVTLIVGEPHAVPRTKTPEDFEIERLRCQEHMLAQIREK
jgi:lysophospholipid acyltransferase (LPLAT)-like uncharacterized protein